MAYNTSRIQVPTSVRLEIENQAKVMKDLHKHLQDIFADVDVDSSLGKSLKKLFDTMDSRFERLDDLFKNEIFSEGDLLKADKIIEKLSDSFSELDRKVKGASLSSLGVDLTEVEKATKALNKLRQEIVQIKGKSVASVIGDSDQLKAFVKASKDTGFKGGESYGKNIDALSDKAEKAETQVTSLKIQFEELTESAEAASKAAEMAASEYEAAGRRLLKSQTATEVVDIGKTHKSKDARFSTYDEYFKQKLGSGADLLTDEGKDFAAIIGEWLDVDPDELVSYADKTADQVVASLSNALRLKAAQHKKEFGGMNVLQNMAKNQVEADQAAGITTQKLQSVYNDAGVRAAEASSEAAQAAESLEGTKGALQEAENLLALIQDHLQKLQELRAAYNKTVDDSFKTQIDAANKAKKEAEDAARSIKTIETSSADESARKIRRVSADTYANTRNKNQKDAEDAREAERFEQELKVGLSHWFGAQQVITMIKDGVRQAWTDIQGLDKAMTNIAVVTDMSVSDLWGKIDQYMAIAQDYGVTTQGVYEVSQLYYQQGLSASEVMEATTETLKMARIAGMDYAEAADAMTVAIRAFKMEMSDAQVITDVYSKVAAVTASDSQELAIAMSKTASSAESVGSSFENTTAMLAVMIETTRESAQNLGSALKSIISRYGEMKVGMTVDSEGEAIDYNKVDTALKSVGISIKDAQGQFRDFDDVIFELSEKWDALDKNTQRYIATIMAGNRQQSRFIALVDSGDRLKEVMDAAHNSADAGLLQYAKTLDSLETKLNALSTSFQQFYMNIVNGDTFKWLIDLVTNVLNGLNKIGTSTTILTGVTLVKAIKTFSSFVLGNFSGLFSEIRKNYKALQDDLTRMAREGATERKAIEEGTIRTHTRQNNPQVVARREQEASLNKAQGYIQAANIAGSIATVAGTALTGAGYERTGSITTGIGNTLSAAGTGGTLGIAIGTALGGPAGAVIGAKVGAGLAAAIAGALSLSDIIDVFSRKIEFEIEKAKKKAEEKNLDRAKAAEEERNLKTTIENLEKLQKARYQSAEAEQAYIDASKEALAAFPELEAQFSSSGDVWIDVLNGTSNAEELLAQARKKTRKATLEAAAAERDQAIKEQKKAQENLEKLEDPKKIGYLARSIVNDIWEESQLDTGDELDSTKVTSEKIDEVMMAMQSELENASSIEDFVSIAEKYNQQLGIDEKVFKNLINEKIKKYYGEEYSSYEELLAATNTARSEVGVSNQKRSAADRGAILAYLEDKDNLNSSEKDLLVEWLDQKKTDADFDKNNNFIPSEALANEINSYEEYVNGLNTEQQKLFDNAVKASQSGTMTFSEIQETLTGIFGEQLPQVIKDWLTSYGTTITEQIINFHGTLIGSKEFLSIADKIDPSKIDYDTDYSNLLEEIPLAYQSFISDYNDHLVAQMNQESGGITLEQGTNSMTALLQLMADASDEELALLTQADLTSITGIQAFIDELTKKAKEEGSNIDPSRIEAWSSFEPVIINFTTEWASFRETAAKQLQLFGDKLGEATSGLNLEDAEKLASQIGADLGTDFELKGEKYYLTNIKLLEEKYLEPVRALQQRILDAATEAKVGKSLEEQAAIDAEAQKALSGLEQYEKNLLFKFYLTNGLFSEALDQIGFTEEEGNLKNEILKYLKTGDVSQLSEEAIQKISPYWNIINEAIIDSLKNVWSEVANSFGTTNVFTANDTNRHIWEELQNFGIVTKIGEDLFKMNSDISEDSVNYALGSANLDTATRNSFYSKWQEYKQKSANILSEIAASPEGIDYSTISDLATEIGQDANLVAERFFEKQIDGTYKITQSGLEQLLGYLGSDASLNPEKDYYRTLYEVYSTKLQEDKKSFLQGLDQNATIDDLMEAHERGWLTVTPEIVKNIREGSTSVYDVLRNAFANEADFQIGNTIRIDDITTELNDTFNSLLSDLTSTSVEDLRDLHYKATGVEANAGETYAYFNAIQQAKDGNVELLRQYIIGLAQQASLKGFDIDFQTINNTLADTAQQLASEILGNLESAIEGTLSAANMHDLSQKLNIDVERYAQATIDGYKVTTDGMLKLGTEMMKQYGETYGVAEKMFDLFVGESGVYKGYRDIVKAAVELDETADKTTAEYKAQKKLLTDMAKIAMFNPDDPLFNFMDQDPSRGMALTAQSMVDTIDKVKEAFSTLKDGENIAATDFYNMMDFMYDQLGSWDNFANALGISDATLAKLNISTTEGANIYEKFVNAIVSNSKILGEVDADVLMNLGLSAENMSKGMSESLKAVADDQIKQLEAMKTTLLAMKELENLDINLGSLMQIDGKDVFLSNFTEFLGIDEDTDNKIIDAVNGRIDEIKNKLFTKGLTEEDWNKVFGVDGDVNLENKAELTAAQNLGKFFEFLEGITEQEATEFARRIDALDETGKIDYSKLFAQIVEIGDWTQFANGLSADIQAAIDTAVAQIDEVEVDANGKYKLKGDQKFTDDIAQQIRDIYAANGYQAVEVGMNGEEIEVHIIDAKVKAMIDASRMAENAIEWQYDFDSQTYKATIKSGTMDVDVEVDKFGTVTYKNQGDPITDSTVEEMLNNSGINIKKTVSGDNQTLQLDLTAAPGTVDATTTIAENVAGIKTILEEGIVIDVTDEATSKLETIEETYIRLVDTLAARPLVISTTGSTLTGIVPTNDQKQGEEQKTLSTLEQKIKVTWEGLDDWKQEDLSQDIKRNFTNKNGWQQSGLVQNVKVNYEVGTVEKPNLGGTGGGVGAQASTPMVNAKGNVNLLKLGAAYARGTLMGELGPELYVQNGAYHIAGAHGPEFVDLDPDAIVFNHLQTANLLGKGHTSKTGSPVVSERRSVAFATGNVSGPAMASGIDSAIEAIDRAIAMWQNIANSTTKDLLSGSGKHKGGGSGNTLKAVTEELQEWYNLTRQIRDLEQDITNLQKERANIPKADGSAYLKSLREEQKLLREQMATQKALLDYQELQLQRQAKHIEKNQIWSQFLTIGEDGLLQYIEGNETNNGKGALQVLQELNQKSAKEQTDFLKSINYSYTDNDGNVLEGEELVEKFFEELQNQIDQYDALYDTVHNTEGILEELQTSIEDINEEIKENQMKLEQAVFDIIVDAWEKEIEQMEEQAELIKEANEAYIDGLNEALSAERQMYDDNQKIADREQLQRQLSLLRRSGGSASEIANLEEQLNDMLKDEYFNNQQKMIEDIQKANDIQVQQLETQIRLQEEALDYQKEHGVIWTQVYNVLSQSRDEILAFMQGKKPEFFSMSLLQQEEMLTEWAHKIGIYKEDQKYQGYEDHARETLWDNGQAWNLGNMSKYKTTYDSLTDEEKNTIRNQFASVYANARMDGKSHEEAAALAAEEVSKTLKRKKDANDAQNNQTTTTDPNPQGNGNENGGGSNGGGTNIGGGGSTTYKKVSITVTAGDGHGSPMPQNASVDPKKTFTIQPNPDGGYEFDYITFNNNKKYSTSITPTGEVSSIAIKVYYKQKTSSKVTTGSGSTTTYNSSTPTNPDPSGHEVGNGQGTGWHFHINKDGKAVFKSAAYPTRETAQAAAQSKLKEYGSGHKYSTKWYSEGGIVDYTGLAMVHGSKTKPESFLNAEQTAQIREGLKESGKGGALEGIKAALLKLDSSIKAVTNINNKSEANSYTIAPGAVVIQVEQLNDAYDVDTLSADIMNRMYTIGNKSTNRGVSRR